MQRHALIIGVFSFSCCAISESVLQKRHADDVRFSRSDIYQKAWKLNFNPHYTEWERKQHIFRRQPAVALRMHVAREQRPTHSIYLTYARFIPAAVCQTHKSAFYDMPITSVYTMCN